MPSLSSRMTETSGSSEGMVHLPASRRLRGFVPLDRPAEALLEGPARLEPEAAQPRDVRAAALGAPDRGRPPQWLTRHAHAGADRGGQFADRGLHATANVVDAQVITTAEHAPCTLDEVVYER